MGRAGKARGEAGEAGGRLKVIGEAGSEAGDEAGSEAGDEAGEAGSEGCKRLAGGEGCESELEVRLEGMLVRLKGRQVRLEGGGESEGW